MQYIFYLSFLLQNYSRKAGSYKTEALEITEETYLPTDYPILLRKHHWNTQALNDRVIILLSIVIVNNSAMQCYK